MVGMRHFADISSLVLSLARSRSMILSAVERELAGSPPITSALLCNAFNTNCLAAIGMAH
jgi:hypothetical protein